MNPGDMFMTQRQSSVKVFPSHLNTEIKKFQKVPLNCRNDEKEKSEGMAQLNLLKTLVEADEAPKINNIGNSSDNSSLNKRPGMKPQKILIHKNLQPVKSTPELTQSNITPMLRPTMNSY